MGGVTERKPPQIRIETWVERQIREAQARGVFDNLPGAGKPIPGLEHRKNTMAWLAEKVYREDLPVTALLPVSLSLAREVDDLPERLAGERSERRVRGIVDDLNRRITRALRNPQDGPPLRVGTQDVEEAVARWRRDREQSS